VSTGNQQLLQRYAQPIKLSTTLDDINTPYSFQTWYSVFQGIIPNQEFKQYNEYLTNWYKDKNIQRLDNALQLKLNYLTLLRQLQVFFTQEEAENWYNQVNIENEKELLLAIPYFAQKLRDISLYYLQLRNTIKESKLTYNQKGTEIGLVQQIQKYLLTNYTQKPVNSITLPASLWKNAPLLSAVKDTINVEIKELYDTGTYFDQSPMVPISAYYDTSSPELISFLSNKGLNTKSIDWIYKLGVYDLSAIVVDFREPLLEENEFFSLTATGFEYEGFAELSKQISQKYLRLDKYNVTQPLISTQTSMFELPIIAGNNFFYWPSGVYKNFAETATRYQKIPLSGTNIETLGTAGTSVDLADTIFVKTTRGIKGAWLKDEPYIYFSQNMAATLDAQAKTEFRFPFPGYGLSASDIQWTGPSLSSDPRFFYLERNIQQQVLNEYWSNSLSLTSNKPFYINDSTLAECKAYPNKEFSLADKITVWTDSPTYTTNIFSGDSKESWLYRFDKTDISIKEGGNSLIYWPYETVVIDPDTEKFPEYYPKEPHKVCLPLPLSGIDFSYAVAGNALSSADIIYKVNNYQDLPEEAIECYWLSGSNTSLQNSVVKIKQNSLIGVFEPGTFTQFTWEGPNNTPIDQIFQTIKHQPDCKYINTPNIDFNRTDLCTCKQVHFVPFGHPGDVFTDYNSHCDFIYEGKTTDDSFDVTTWRDSTSSPYISSAQFFWYKTNNKQDWGNGRWVTGGSPRRYSNTLKTGKTYIYYRANTRLLDKETSSYPKLIVRHSYNSYLNNYGTKHVWIKSTKTQNGNWVSTDLPAQSVIAPGDLLIYSRKPTLTTSITGTVLVETPTSENRGSVWSSFDYVSIDSGNLITVTFPILDYPGITVSNFQGVRQWILSTPNNTTQTYDNITSFSFYPLLTGLYSLRATVLTGIRSTSDQSFLVSALVTITDIPEITAVPLFIPQQTLTAVNVPIPGYVLNTQLQGWNYRRSNATNLILSRDGGAKPFWAKTYTEKDINTNFKSIKQLGTPQREVDEFNFITQPEISDIILTPGSKITYERNYSTNINWVQPVDLVSVSNRKEWCNLEFSTNQISNLSKQLNNFKTELLTNATNEPTTIILENYVDNEPVEVYYNAVNPFTWSITVTSEIPTVLTTDLSAEDRLIALTPWANLPNINYPTVAAVPSIKNLHTVTELGGYFTPKHLGASVYTEHNYLLTLTSYITSYFSQVEYSRGLTKQDQPSPYTFTVNNNWLKEPVVSGPIAGINNKKIFKKYQKFIPYQSNYESNPRNRIGLLNPTSRQTPWTGIQDSEWGDTANFPVSFTGEIDVNKWSETQVLKKAKLQIDNWITDIFGNQYGLYKDIKDIEPVKRIEIPGEIWVRNNAQFVSPAYISLANVFDTYQNISLINELTGNGINKIDMFFDTLMIQTSGVVLFEKINYDYITNTIFSLTDEARYLSLAIPVTASLDREFSNQINLADYAKCGETWFLPNEKIVYLSICSLQNSKIIPEIYSYNINSLKLTKIFPLDNNDIITLNELSSLNINSFNLPVLSYNTNSKEFLYAITVNSANKDTHVIELKINNFSQVTLKDITVYSPQSTTLFQTPPIILNDLNLNLSRPDPLGNIFLTTSILFSTVTAGIPLVIENRIDKTKYFATAPIINGQTVYPFLSFVLSGVGDIAFQQPIQSFYSVYNLNPLYIEKYGSEVLFFIEPINFKCSLAFNTSAIFTPIDLPDWLNLSIDGSFDGIPPSNFERFSGSFKVTNNFGPTFYALNIKVV